MNWLQGLDLPKIVTTISVLFALATLCVREVSRARRRSHQLRAAAMYLKTHFDAMERLVSDPATPDFILDAIYSFEGKFLDRDSARSMTARLCSDEPQGSPNLSERDHAALAGLKNLQKHRKDLHDDFITWVMSGTFAGILRWPETAEMMEAMMARVAGDLRKEEKFASRILVDKTPTTPFHNLMAVPAG